MRTLLWALFLAGITPVFAGVTITLVESGSDVVMTHTGTLDTTGLTLSFSNQPAIGWNLYPQSGALQAGAGNRDTYSGFSAAGGSFGSGSFTAATSSSGDLIYVSAAYISVPYNFVSGSSLSGSNTFTGASFSSLNVTPGTYVWSWDADSITLNISASAVPEPSTYAAIAGLAVFGLVLLRRRSSARSTEGRDC